MQFCSVYVLTWSTFPSHLCSLFTDVGAACGGAVSQTGLHQSRLSSISCYGASASAFAAVALLDCSGWSQTCYSEWASFIHQHSLSCGDCKHVIACVRQSEYRIEKINVLIIGSCICVSVHKVLLCGISFINTTVQNIENQRGNLFALIFISSFCFCQFRRNKSGTCS